MAGQLGDVGFQEFAGEAGVGVDLGGSFGEGLGGHAADDGDGEVAAGAVGFFAVAMADDPVGADVVGFFEVGDEAGQGLELGGRRAGNIEIADEADADAVFVVAVLVGLGVLGVGPDALFAPAGADFDLAIAGFGAVSDDEVVAEVDEVAGAVVGVELSRSAGGGGAVVDDDHGPLARRGGGQPFARHAIGSGEVGRGGWKGNSLRGAAEVGLRPSGGLGGGVATGSGQDQQQKRCGERAEQVQRCPLFPDSRAHNR